MGYVLRKLGAKRFHSATDRSEQGRRFLCMPAALSPPRSELLAILPHDCGCLREANPDAAAFVDIGAFGGNAPDDILSGQYRCHAATLTCRFATIAIMGLKCLSTASVRFCLRDTRDRYLACRHPDAEALQR